MVAATLRCCGPMPDDTAHGVAGEVGQGVGLAPLVPGYTEEDPGDPPPCKWFVAMGVIRGWGR